MAETWSVILEKQVPAPALEGLYKPCLLTPALGHSESARHGQGEPKLSGNRYRLMAGSWGHPSEILRARIHGFGPKLSQPGPTGGLQSQPNAQGAFRKTEKFRSKKKLRWLRSLRCRVPLPQLSLLRHHVHGATFVLCSAVPRLFGLRARPPCTPGVSLCVHKSELCLPTLLSRPLSHRDPGSTHPVLESEIWKKSLLLTTEVDVPPPCQTKI